MSIPPLYPVTAQMLRLIAQINANRIFFNDTPLPQQIKDNLKRTSILKSSLFSARIEGNTLTFEEIQYAPDKKKKLEVFNILRAIEYIERTVSKDTKLTINFI